MNLKELGMKPLELPLLLVLLVLVWLFFIVRQYDRRPGSYRERGPRGRGDRKEHKSSGGGDRGTETAS